MTLAKSISKGLVIVCVATVIAEGIGFGHLWVNGSEEPLAKAEHHDVKTVTLSAADESVQLNFGAPLDLWVIPMVTSLRDLDGYHRVHQGVRMIALVSLEQTLEATLSLEAG